MSSTTKSSLLLNGTEGDEVPTLGGTEFESEEYESPLERLIAHSTSEQRGNSVDVSAPWKERQHENTLDLVDNTYTLFSRRGRRTLRMPISPYNLRKKSSLLTLATCTCSILQIGFTWASFLSPSWLDTRLHLSLSAPSIEIANGSQLLHSTTLGSLLGDLLDGDQHWAAVALVITSIILPCLCAVCGAIWIIEDIDEQKRNTSNTDVRNSKGRPNKQQSSSCPRKFIEYTARIGFCIFFIFLILYIGTSPVEILLMESRIVVVNEIKGGLASYTLGMFFGLSVLVLLRIGRTNFERIFKNAPIEAIRSNTFEKQDYNFFPEVDSAKLATRIRDVNESERGQKEGQLVMPLLQSECSDKKISIHGNSLFLDTENAIEVSDKHPCLCIQLKSEGLQAWKRIILYELALISTVLWLPTLFLPLFHVKYEGFVSHFASEVSFSLRLKDFPEELWERGNVAGVNRFILCMSEIIFLLLVVVCPVTATLSAIGTCIFDTRSSNFCKHFLWSLQPFLGVVLFGAALHLTIPAFETVLKSAMDKLGSGICSNFEAAAAETCFAIKAEPSVGLYFLLVEAISLEIFVFLTLKWHD